ncbi:MAG: cryptochrome/photolyase family protein [Bacteroidetes bacterium]|nr:cryptochrome/photolyase family protein [Bacteroidota bacterium]
MSWSTTVKTARLIFPNTLYPTAKPVDQEELVLVEEDLFFSQYDFHKNKLSFHRASLTACQESLLKKHQAVHYIRAGSAGSDIRALIPHLSKQGFSQVITENPTDYLLERRLRKAALKANVKLTVEPSHRFISSDDFLTQWFSGRKNYFQTDFYIAQRKRLGLLLDKEGKPLKGKWSFDAENRARYPKNKKPPVLPIVKKSAAWISAQQEIDAVFKKNPGSAVGLTLPVNPTQARAWLQSFLEQRFKSFGEYEDAMVQGESFLHHSLLSPLLNAGLLSPEEVVSSAVEAAREFNVPYNSLEGFVRQIVGWREFIRGVYQFAGVKQRTTNFFNHRHSIPNAFYTATTGIFPVDEVIGRLLKTGYSHHIERLMILSNFMLLCEIHPDEVYRWFMEMYVDAYDWVMVPNVYGMGQFADGGLMCSKPYISGSNYILKMSNYSKDPAWTEVWDGLFWRFMDKQRAFFLGNPRLGMLVKMFDGMDIQKRKAHLRTAEKYLEKLHR